MNQESTYRVICESCEEGIIGVDQLGSVKIANRAAHEMFAYDQGELIGLSVEQLIPIALRNSHKRDRKNYQKKPTPRKMGVGRDLLALKKDGTEFPVEISLNQAEIKGEKHVVAFIIDISARKNIEIALKKSEEQLLTYASELEKRVKQRTEELMDANKKLEKEISVRRKAEQEAKLALEKERELHELKSRFVSMASHEFRTPLSTILSSASLISKYEGHKEATEKRLRHIGKIKSSINNLNGILNEFLSLAKLEEGKVEVASEQIDIHQIINEAIEEITTIKKEGQQILLKVTGKERLISGDNKIMRNVLLNLMSNAIKYSEKERDIHVRLKYNKNKTIIEIEDQGVGIPQEDQKHLFERFFRAKNATNTQGTGLGLNIVKKYVEMLGGKISFKSELNVGTTFTITLS